MVDVDFYLVVGQRVRSGYADGRPTIRTSKSAPNLEGHEVAIGLNLRLPLALFRRPALSASIVVPESQAPFEITPEIQSNIAKAVQEQLGITLRVEAPQA